MLAVGEPAPDFSAESSTGPVHLRALRGGPVVLYFYPQADTSGCTIESKKFRDLLPSLTGKGVRVLGISTDTVPEQQAFAAKCSLPFPLIADTSKRITETYGVLRTSGRARRVTFFIDAEGRIEEIVDQGAPEPHTNAAVRRYLSA